MIACCPSCRLLQPEAERCAHCGDVRPLRADEADQLLRSQVESVQVVSKPPPGHGREGGLVIATMFLMIIGAVAGDLITHSPIGGLAGMATGMVGYRKHFWRMVVVRKPGLRPVAEPKPPVTSAVVAIVGTAKLFEHAVASTVSEGRPLLVASVAVRVDRQLVLRAVRAAPFWVIAEDGRRVLITGACWLTGAAQTVIATKQILSRLEVPAGLPVPKRATIDEARLAPDDRVTVTGIVREEHLAGLGYRDSATETMRGEPGAVVWIERMD